MKRKRCATCDKSSHTLLSANCGHKICYFCVKSNRNSHKCANCSKPPPKKSPLSASRKTLHKSSVNILFEENKQILCKEHRQPLTLFCPSTHELICSVCLCSKMRSGPHFVPLIEAYDPLKSDVKQLREEAKGSLLQLDQAHKTINRNVEVFRHAHQRHVGEMELCFREMREDISRLEGEKRKELDDFFKGKIREATESADDLQYLTSVLKEHRDGFKDSSTLNELVYMLTSYHMINSTIRNLDLDFVSYGNRDIHLCEINRDPFIEGLRGVMKMKLSLPLKYKVKSSNRSRQEELSPESKLGYTPPRKDRNSLSRKHQNSWGGTIYNMRQPQQQLSLYKVLLRSKLKT